MELKLTYNKSSATDIGISKTDFEIVKYLYDKEIERERQIENSPTPLTVLNSLGSVGIVYNSELFHSLLKHKILFISFCILFAASLVLSFSPKFFSSKVNQINSKMKLCKISKEGIVNCLNYIHNSNNKKIWAIRIAYVCAIIWIWIFIAISLS